MVEPVDSDFGSVFFVGRESFRMQISGTPGPVVDEPAVPVHLPHTPTMRIVDRRQRDERRRSNERRSGSAFEPAADWMPGSMPSLSKRALIGLCLITFSSGILVATAIYRLRPSARASAVAAQPVLAAQPAPVERIVPAATPSVAVIQPMAEPEPEPVPAPEAPTVAVAQAPAVAVPPVAAKPALAAKPAPAVKPAPAIRARPTPAVHPKRPLQPTGTRVATPKATEPDLFAPPASKKWVDPFAE